MTREEKRTGRRKEGGNEERRYDKEGREEMERKEGRTGRRGRRRETK